MTYYTASADRGRGGSWWSCRSRLVGNVWVVESQNRRLEIVMPGNLELEVLWDSQGARVVTGLAPDNGGDGDDGNGEDGGGSDGGQIPAAIQKAKEWAGTLPDLADRVRGKNQPERKALRQIANRGRQIVRLLSGQALDAIRRAKDWAETLPGLADQVAGKNQKERRALRQVANRGRQIVKLLGG